MHRTRNSAITATTVALAIVAPACAPAQTREPSQTQTAADTIVLAPVVLSAGSGAESAYVAESSANRIPTDPLNTATSVSAYTAARIADQDIRSDLDLLSQTPGVDVTSTEGFFTIRGYNGSVSIEGVDSDTFVGRTSADLSPFEQVEIIKGPAAISQGRGALGGMVDYQFKRPLAAEQVMTRLSVSNPSAAQAMVDWNLAPALDGRWRTRVVLSYEDRDLQTAPEGYKRASLFAVTEFDLTDRTTLRLNAWRQRNDSTQDWRTGLPAYSDGSLIDLPRDTTLTQDWALYKFSSLWLGAELEHSFSDRWRGKLTYRKGDSHHPSLRAIPYNCEGPLSQFDYTTTGIDRDNPDGRQCMTMSYWNDWNQHQIIDASVNGEVDAFGRSHEVVFGATERKDWFRRAFGAPTVPSDFVNDLFNPDDHVIDLPDYVINRPWGDKPLPSKEYTLFGQANIKVTDKLTLPIGGRVTWAKDSDDVWTAKKEFTPSLGAIYKPDDDTTFYAQYAQTFTPSLYDFAWNPDWTPGSSHPAEDGIRLPNQTGTQHELGFKKRLFDNAIASVALFEIREQNVPRADTDPDHVEASGGSFSIATGETRSRGVEVALNGSITPNWQVGAAYSFIDAIYVSDDFVEGARLGTARHSANLWTTYAFTEGRWDGLTLGAGWRGKSDFLGYATDEDDTNRVRGPGYGIVSASASYAISDNLRASANVENLFDRKYYDVVGDVGSENYYGEGRRVSVSLNAKF